MNSRGFTLIELLITLSLLVIVSVTLIATLFGGTRVWKRVQCQGSQDQMALVAFYEMRKNFRNTHPFLPIEYEGKYDEFSYPVLMSAIPRTEEGDEESLLDAVTEPGRQGYYFQSQQGVLCRSQDIYRKIRKNRLRESCLAVVENVERVRFHYLVYDQEKEKYDWTSSFKSEWPPLAVQLNIRYHDRCSDESLDKKVKFYIPQGRIG